MPGEEGQSHETRSELKRQHPRRAYELCSSRCVGSRHGRTAGRRPLAPAGAAPRVHRRRRRRQVPRPARGRPALAGGGAAGQVRAAVDVDQSQPSATAAPDRRRQRQLPRGHHLVALHPDGRTMFLPASHFGPATAPSRWTRTAAAVSGGATARLLPFFGQARLMGRIPLSRPPLRQPIHHRRRRR